MADIVPLGTLLKRRPRYGINAAAVELRPGVPTYIRITDIDDDGRFAPDPKVGVLDPTSVNYQLAPGEIVVARTGASVGKSYLYDPADGDLIYAGFLINLAPDPARLDPGYLSHYLHTKPYWDWVARTSIRSGQPGVNGREYAELAVPAPDPRLQRSIASSLDDVAALITVLERLIQKKEDVKIGLMQELLSGRKRLQGFGGPWSLVTLGDHVRFIPTVPVPRDQLDGSSALRYLHYGDIHTSSEVRLDAALASMPRVNAALGARAGQLRIGDLVFADASEDPGGVGKSVEISAIPGTGVVAGLHTIAARFDKSVLADGFKAYLQFIPAFRRQLLRLAAGTKVLATTKAYIASISMELPGASEQQAVARVLQDVDLEITVLKRRLAKARAVKQGMMQVLMNEPTHLLELEAAA